MKCNVINSLFSALVLWGSVGTVWYPIPKAIISADSSFYFSLDNNTYLDTVKIIPHKSVYRKKYTQMHSRYRTFHVILLSTSLSPVLHECSRAWYMYTHLSDTIKGRTFGQAEVICMWMRLVWHSENDSSAWRPWRESPIAVRCWGLQRIRPNQSLVCCAGKIKK